MTILLPRLPGQAADRLIDHMLGDEDFRWSGFNAHALPDEVRYAPTGGTTISPARLKELREELVRLASECGFPEAPKRGGHAAFDAAVGQWTVHVNELNSGEALRNDVWAFFTIVLAPDIVHWRFGKARERYLGGIRNTFQRTWLRAKVLDRGPGHPDRWGLLRELSEDALVTITERPSVGADPVLARELGEAWVRAAAGHGRGRMEDVMRLATLRIRIRNEVRALPLLPRHELEALVEGEFARAAASVIGDKSDEAAASAVASTDLEPEGAVGDYASGGIFRNFRKYWVLGKGQEPSLS